MAGGKKLCVLSGFLARQSRGDTRITVIGKRAFGFHRANRAGDFRASGSKIIDFGPSRVDPECVRLAHRISKSLGAQSMAYDFLVDTSGRQVLSEIEPTSMTIAPSSDVRDTGIAIWYGFQATSAPQDGTSRTSFR